LSSHISSPLELFDQLNIDYHCDLVDDCPNLHGYYFPCCETIELRQVDWYASIGEFNHSALHELCHWSRHPSRLGPLPVKNEDDEFYEEIVVDVAAAIIADRLGLERRNRDQCIDYVYTYLEDRILSTEEQALIIQAVSETASFILREKCSLEKAKSYLIEFETFE
jgi:antirestriction protein ArdC